MKTAKVIAAVILLFIVLTACGKPQERTVYADANVVITRTGSRTSVLDAQSGKAYHYTTHRVKRHTEDSEAHRAQVLTETPNLYIHTAKGIIVITVKRNLETIIVPATKSH